jgi:hypothetical protein
MFSSTLGCGVKLTISMVDYGKNANVGIVQIIEKLLLYFDNFRLIRFVSFLHFLIFSIDCFMLPQTFPASCAEIKSRKYLHS